MRVHVSWAVIFPYTPRKVFAGKLGCSRGANFVEQLGGTAIITVRELFFIFPSKVWLLLNDTGK